MNTGRVENFIQHWHRIFAEDDPALMLPLIDDDIEFYSPAIFAPKHGKQEVFELLCVVFDVFENYRVTDTWIKGDEVLFEFEAGVGKYTLQGIDRFRLNSEGKVAQMKVWIRPLTGLRELARTVSARGLEDLLAENPPLRRLAIRAQTRASKINQALKDGLR